MTPVELREENVCILGHTTLIADRSSMTGPCVLLRPSILVQLPHFSTDSFQPGVAEGKFRDIINRFGPNPRMFG
jgi:hypothetical protein